MRTGFAEWNRGQSRCFRLAFAGAEPSRAELDGGVGATEEGKADGTRVFQKSFFFFSFFLFLFLYYYYYYLLVAPGLSLLQIGRDGRDGVTEHTAISIKR